MALFAGKTVFVFARGLMPGFGEILIATAAASTLRDQNALARLGKIRDGLAGFFVVSERADGNQQESCRRRSGRCSSSLRRGGRDRL